MPLLAAFSSLQAARLSPSFLLAVTGSYLQLPAVCMALSTWKLIAWQIASSKPTRRESLQPSETPYKIKSHSGNDIFNTLLHLCLALSWRHQGRGSHKDSKQEKGSWNHSRHSPPTDWCSSLLFSLPGKLTLQDGS